MESINKFLKEKDINANNICYLLQNIANEIINSNENIKYGNGIILSFLDGNTAMYFDSNKKIFVINYLFLDFINNLRENRMIFLTLFVHECMHAIENENYNNEVDPIKKFFDFIKVNSSCTFNKFDNNNHDYYYSEIDTHKKTLNFIDKLGLQKNLVDKVKNLYLKNSATNLVYIPNKEVEYYFNNKKTLMTIEQIELYKALMIRNQKEEQASPLFLELTPNNNFHSMKKNIEFLQSNYNKYGLGLENVILHIEKNKVVDKQEIYIDIISLIQSYINPQSKVDFFEKLLFLKINKFITLENIEQEFNSIINYLKDICNYYYQTNINFYYYLVNILNYLISIKEQKLLIK